MQCLHLRLSDTPVNFVIFITNLTPLIGLRARSGSETALSSFHADPLTAALDTTPPPYISEHGGVVEERKKERLASEHEGEIVKRAKRENLIVGKYSSPLGDK